MGKDPLNKAPQDVSSCASTTASLDTLSELTVSSAECSAPSILGSVDEARMKRVMEQSEKLVNSLKDQTPILSECPTPSPKVTAAIETLKKRLSTATAMEEEGKPKQARVEPELKSRAQAGDLPTCPTSRTLLPTFAPQLIVSLGGEGVGPRIERA